MGDICIHFSYSIYVIFVSILYSSSGYDSIQLQIPPEQQKQYHGYEATPFVVCPCKPCMTGPKCDEKVSELNPRFGQRYYYIELSEEYKPGSPIPYNSTTYPGGKECPCEDFEYALTDVRNEVEELEGAADETAVFSVNKNTGEISLNRPLKTFEFYKMTITARNKVTNATDDVKISVALEPPTRRINRYHPEVFNGYEIDVDDVDYSYSHHISKRSVIDPTEVNFTLSVNGDTNSVKVGSKLEFTLDIVFPAVDVDMLIELFTPDNETTVMILCNVMVASIGSNLSPSVGTPTVVMDSKDNSIQYDRAIIDLGTVTNSGADTVNIGSSTITITYEAIMIKNPATVNGKAYWVSAGAEYDNESKIWVGQASATVNTDMTASGSATFNVGLPTNMALGSSHLVPVDMFLPYPSSTYVFNVFTPLDTSGIMSVCAVMFNDVAQNFGCGNDLTQVNETLTPDSTNDGNSQGTINLGMLLNKGSRDVAPVTADNRVTVYFVIHLYPNEDLVGQNKTIGIALEVDSSTIWAGNSDVTIDGAVLTGLTDPVFVSLTTDLVALQATIGEPFKVLVNISIPAPTTAGVATPYVLEVLAPFSSTAIFKLCGFEIISVGRDLPCVNKDELQATYYSRASTGSSLADRATIDLGYVMNINHYQGSGDDIIQVQAIFSPNADHPSATDGSTHTITFGATVGKETPTSLQLATEDIVLSGTATVTPISNATAPSFTMSYYDSATNAQADEISVLESTKVLVTMATTRNVLYTKMDVEFLMPVDTDYAFMHVCKAEIKRAGKNLPCLTPTWTNSLVQYDTKFSNYYMDRASMYVGSLCNKELVDDVAEDEAEFALYLKVLDVPTLLDMDESWISTGLMYSETQLWVGQIKVIVRRGETIGPVGTPYASLSKNFTLADIPLGYYGVYSLLLKIPPGDRTDLEITATIDKPGLDICSIRVAAVGANLPCVIDDLATKTYAPQSATIDLDIVTNFGDGTLTNNNYFDDNSIMVEFLLRADTAFAADTYQLDVTSYYDTAKTIFDTRNQTGITTSSDLMAIDTSVPTAVTGTLTVGEIAGGDTDANIAVGETKRILLSVVIPDESVYDLSVAVTIVGAFVGKLELCDAAIFSVGKNLPCVTTTIAPTITSAGGIYNDNAEFVLGYVCNRPVIPGNTEENTLRIEAWVRLLPNAAGMSAVGTTVTVAASVTTFGSTVTVSTLDLTVTDPTTFVDKVKSLAGVNNSTLIATDQTSGFAMSVGENKTIRATVTVPPYSVSRFMFDVDLSVVAGVSACMTVRDISVTSIVGANIPCFAPDVSKGISYTPIYISNFNTTQAHYGYIDFGIITNTGKTHHLGTNITGDDDVIIDVTVQMADCANSDNQTSMQLSLGNKIASLIFIYDNTVTVLRNGNEMPDLVLVLTKTEVSNALFYLDGILKHSPTSTAEGYNTTISIWLPDFLIPPTTLVSASLSSFTITSDPSTPNLLEIFFNNFFFSDYFEFRAAISVDTSAFVPNGFSSDDTTIFSEVGTNYISRAPTYDAEDWFPYPIFTGPTIHINLNTNSGEGCTIVALGLGSGAIQDCQIFGSPDYLPSHSPQMGRIASGSAWKPGIRDGSLARKKYFEVYFGNVVELYQIQISQTVSVDLATELLIDYSNDGEAWFGAEEIDLGPSPSTSETRTLATVVQARYARIQITNDTNNLVKAEPALNFEFYGCVVTSDVSDPCASLSTTTSRPTDFYTRSFVENPTNGYVFVCDTDSSSSDEEGRCHTSTDGDLWTAIDERLGSLNGYEATEGHLYGYDNDLETVLVSNDDGVTWNSADAEELAKDKLKSWTDAIEVPLDITVDLDNATPTSLYTINTWGATYDGLFKNNVLKLRWSSS